MTRWPNFFIVGAAKAGTTSLHHHLAEHPQIFMSTLKEPHFFSSFSVDPWQMRLHHVIRDEARYLSLFTEAGDAPIIGESSASYLWDVEAARRIGAVAPHARIVAVLRDPVERAFSHYLNDVREGITSLLFADAIRNELDGSHCRWPSLYVDFGRYAEQLARYRDVFGAGVLVVFFDDLISNPVQEVGRILSFVGVQPTHLKWNAYAHLNFYARPRNDIARRIFGYPPARLLARAVVPPRARGTVRRIVWSSDTKRPTMDNVARNLLCDVFHPEIRPLENLLGQNVPWRDSW